MTRATCYFVVRCISVNAMSKSIAIGYSSIIVTVFEMTGLNLALNRIEIILAKQILSFLLSHTPLSVVYVTTKTQHSRKHQPYLLEYIFEL